MKLILRSDFIDWYDYAFDVATSSDDVVIFERFSNSREYTRREALDLLKNKGYYTPLYGTVNEVAEKMIDQFFTSFPDLIEFKHKIIHDLMEVVIYHDEYGHRGEGKEILQLDVAMKEYPDKFCVKYIPNSPDGLGYSRRVLVVGNNMWLIDYWSENDWRSNCGDVHWKVLNKNPLRSSGTFKYPMYAIDFVQGYAIDFNTAPGLEPLKEILPPDDVVKFIKEYYQSTAVHSSINKK